MKQYTAAKAKAIVQQTFTTNVEWKHINNYLTDDLLYINSIPRHCAAMFIVVVSIFLCLLQFYLQTVLSVSL